jgi:hypothetical protein
MAAAVVGLIVLALVALAIWAWRKNREKTLAQRQALEALARRLGSSVAPGHTTVTGSLDGRACRVEEERLHTAGTDGDDVEYTAKVTVETHASIELAIGPTMSSTGTPRLGGAPIGDPVLDEVLIIETSDPARLSAALDVEARRSLGEWGRTRWLRRLQITNGQLWAETGLGLVDREAIERIGTLLDVITRLLSGLEQPTVRATGGSAARG